MAILKDAKVFVDGFDFSGDTRALAMDYDAEDQDDTRFGDDTRKLAADTLKTFAWNLEGFWKAGSGEPDPEMFTRVGSTDHVVTIVPVSSTGAVGDIGYLYKGLAKGYQFGGSVGDNLPFTANGGVRSNAVRGTVLHGATVTGSGTGTLRELGGVGSGQALYGALHIVTAAGSTNDIDVVVQSDSSTSFGTPTTRLTFSQASGIGGQFATGSGSTGDVYYRVSHTVAGATASFKYYVTVGIL